MLLLLILFSEFRGDYYSGQTTHKVLNIDFISTTVLTLTALILAGITGTWPKSLGLEYIVCRSLVKVNNVMF